jgi:anti-sigma factor RsiW
MIRRFLARRRYMREHRWTQQRLSSYLDGELTRPDRERVEAHTGICPQCRRVLATLRRTLEGLGNLSAQPGRNVTDGVIERLRREG